MEIASHLLMIRPVRFAFNAETAVNNAFQVEGGGDVQDRALEEFDRFVALLRENGVDVTVVEDTPEPHTPDAIFPNNWVSFHRRARPRPRARARPARRARPGGASMAPPASRGCIRRCARARTWC